MHGYRAIRYIFFETLPAFVMGVLVFILILLMLQALRLTEFVLVHGVSLKVLGEIMLYQSISFLPIILPMSLLFSVLLTYSRLSNDSEVVAFKALGLSMAYLMSPAVLLAGLATFMSVQSSFYLGPWGNRRQEVLIHEVGQQKVGATIQEATFSEGFFDLVVYANKVDSKAGLLKDVFIYDERDARSPVTIIAKQGHLIQEKTKAGLSAFLRLIDGNIHRTQQDTYTKVDFSSYDINLFNPYELSERSKSPPSMTIDEVSKELKKTDLEPGTRREMEVEYHRRWSLSLACIIFALLGIGLGTVTNRRSSKGSGFVLCLGVLISYWICYVGAEAVAKNGWMPAAASLWLVNALYLSFALNTIRKVWN
jgi:lipopolysaccharide export system permease protein